MSDQRWSERVLVFALLVFAWMMATVVPYLIARYS